MDCLSCKKKNTCKKICQPVEKILTRVNKYSLKSNYLVKFVDPYIIESCCKNINIEKYNETEYSNYLKKNVMVIIRELSFFQRFCIIHYYGLLGEEKKTQTEIAKLLNVSQNTIKYHLKNAYNIFLNILSNVNI